MDGLTLARSVAEIQCLAGGKVEKIQQPERMSCFLLFIPAEKRKAAYLRFTGKLPHSTDGSKTRLAC